MSACRHGHDIFHSEPCEKCLLEITQGRVTASVTIDGKLTPDLYPPSLRKLEPLTPHDRLVIERLLAFHNTRVKPHENLPCRTNAGYPKLQFSRV